MRKELIFIALLIGLNWALSQFSPWWNLAIVAFILAYLFGFKNIKSFWLGFGAIFVFWLGYLFIINAGNEGLLSSKIAALFAMESSYMPFFVSAIMGALVSGFSAAAGSSLRNIFDNKGNQKELDRDMNMDEMQKLRPEWKDKSHI